MRRPWETPRAGCRAGRSRPKCQTEKLAVNPCSRSDWEAIEEYELSKPQLLQAVFAVFTRVRGRSFLRSSNASFASWDLHTKVV